MIHQGYPGDSSTLCGLVEMPPFAIVPYGDGRADCPRCEEKSTLPSDDPQRYPAVLAARRLLTHSDVPLELYGRAYDDLVNLLDEILRGAKMERARVVLSRMTEIHDEIMTRAKGPRVRLPRGRRRPHTCLPKEG